MTRERTVVLLGLISLMACLPNAAQARSASQPFQQWGEETISTIYRDLWMPKLNLYGEQARLNEPPKEPSFMWGCGVELSALAGAARMEPDRYTVHLRAYADALNVYWTLHGGIGGYDVHPAPKPSDRYYDDNAWVVLGMADTYEDTHVAGYLARSEATFHFVMSGEDDKLGGGLYWKENEKSSKNTCSNAPATVGALRLYELTKKPEYLATARRLYAWTRAHLEDTDGLYWDNIKLDGRVDRAKYSYNTALMIRANCLFYALTHEAAYLVEAQRSARAAEAKWVVPADGAMNDTGRFAHLLCESFLALHAQDKDRHWVTVVSDALVYLHDKVRDPVGHYPDRWNTPSPTPLSHFALIDQASAARVLDSGMGAEISDW